MSAPTAEATDSTIRPSELMATGCAAGPVAAQARPPVPPASPDEIAAQRAAFAAWKLKPDALARTLDLVE